MAGVSDNRVATSHQAITPLLYIPLSDAEEARLAAEFAAANGDLQSQEVAQAQESRPPRLACPVAERSQIRDASMASPDL